jgi:hypothetical protein
MGSMAGSNGVGDGAWRAAVETTGQRRRATWEGQRGKQRETKRQWSGEWGAKERKGKEREVTDKRWEERQEGGTADRLSNRQAGGRTRR